MSPTNHGVPPPPPLDDEDEETVVQTGLAVPNFAEEEDEPESTIRYSKEEVEAGMRLGYINPLPRADSKLVATGDEKKKRETFHDRYERLSWIGEGGMGEIALFKDHHIGREVAVKMLLPEQATLKTARERFIREARVQGQLEHPAIVPVYDAGLDEDGQLYFTMRRIHGISLADVIDQLMGGDADAVVRFTRRRLLAAFGTVCLAVDMAHRRGVVHRDLKPENIMLGEFGEVQLLDWGLAKLRGEVADPREVDRRVTRVDEWRKVTEVGAVMGTLGYMAPEQLRGDEGLNTAADIYSLGAILFELCTLTPLHPGLTPQEIVASTLSGVEARPSVRCPELHVPNTLERIIRRAVMQEPEQRYTARALHDAVEHVLDSERDIEKHRDQAEHHAQRARRHARKAHRDLDERRRSLREVWRSLSHDPDNRLASQTLSQLLMEVPEVVPPNVAHALGASDPLMTWARRFTLISYALLLSTLLVVILAGNPGWAAIGLVAVTALFAVVMSSWLAWSITKNLREARTRAELLNWHIYELLPSRTHGGRMSRPQT